MSSVAEAILFVASNSNASMPCITFVTQRRVPVQIVRLDSVEARNTAANGKYFQVTSVPTMVIMYNDGNTQIFIGTPKILQWLGASLNAKQNSGAPSSRPEYEAPSQLSNMYGPIGVSHPLGKARRPAAIEDDDSPIPIGDDRRDYEDEDAGEEEHFEPPPPSRRAPVVVEDDEDEPPPPVEKPKKGRGKGRPTRKPVVDYGEDEANDPVAAKRKLARDKLNRAASSKSKPLSSRMKDVYSMAKNMEEERLGALGYKEEDLPHY